MEMKPLCVLDFFVDSSVQRGGHGKHLFDTMLAVEAVAPAKLAYDRPSPKLLSFLRKYFGLAKYVQQNNNYVVFDDYYSVESSLGFNDSQFGRIHGKTATSGWTNENENHQTIYEKPLARTGMIQPKLALNQKCKWDSY